MLYIFNLWGFSVEIPDIHMSLKWTRVIFCVHIIISCYICSFVWQFLNENLEKKIDLLSVANNVIKFSAALIAYWAIIVESYSKRSVQQKFWRIYRQIYNDFNREDRNLMFRNSLNKFVHFFIFFTGLDEFIRWISFLNGLNVYFKLPYIGLMMMQDMRIFYYLFFIRLLNHQLEEVAIEMELLADANERGIFLKDRLKWVRIFYDSVHGMSNCINEIFGWSSIIGVLFLFLRLVVDLNWIYWRIHRQIEVEILRTFEIF